MKCFLSLLFAALLSGCASTPSVSSVLKQIGQFNQEMLQEEDAHTANAVKSASGALSLRVSRLDDKPRTVAALATACREGKGVELLAHVSAQAHSSALKQACSHVYFSADPRLLDSQDVMVVDGQRMWVEGRKVSASRKMLEDEFFYWQSAKRSASFRP